MSLMRNPTDLRRHSRQSIPPPPRVRSRKMARLWWGHQWPIILAVSIALLALAYLGFRSYYLHHPAAGPHGPTDLLYYSLQLVPMNSGAMEYSVPWQLEAARLLLPVVATYAVVAAVLVLFASQLQRLRLLGLKDHLVICGLGSRGTLLAIRFRSLGYPTVAIESDPYSQSLDECRDAGVIALGGQTADEASLRRAGVSRAACLIALDGSDSENANVAINARPLCSHRRQRPLTCVINITEPRLYEVMRSQQFRDDAWPGMRLDLFNTAEVAARGLLDEYPLPTDRPPCIVVVGLGELGTGVLLRAARDWTPQCRRTGARMLAYVVDPEASKIWSRLCMAYPRLGDVCDAFPRAADGRVLDSELGDSGGDSLIAHEPDVAFVCAEDDTAGVVAALGLSAALRGASARVVLAVTRHSGLATLVSSSAGGTLTAPLIEFPIHDRTCTPDRVLGGTHETLARAIHGDYVRVQVALGETQQTNPSLVAWDELPQRLQDASRRQADDIGSKLSAIGCGLEALTDWDADLFAFAPDEIERLAVLEHERWLEDYQASGWRYAPGAKSVEQKTHPSLVPWVELSEAEREKDRDVVRLLPTLLARAGLQVARFEPRGRL